jgi:hypothetical protein
MAPIAAVAARPRRLRVGATFARLLVGSILALIMVVLPGSQAASAATTVTASCVDGAGIVWRTRVVWGGTYIDAAGIRRVAVSVAGWTTKAGRMPTDSTVRTYGPTGALVQTLVKTATFDYQNGTSWDQRNPRNPPTGPGRSKVTIRVSRDGDGKPGCTVTSTQPATVFLTGYTWWDNTPAGSAAIAHPVLHSRAGGVGTYADPITMAVGYTNAGPDIPFGTRSYLRGLQRYAIVEDLCGACHKTPAGATWKLDLWLDGRHLTPTEANACAYRITGYQTVLRSPPRGLPVKTGPICT